MEPGVIGMLIALVILVLASYVLWRVYIPKAAAEPKAKNLPASSARVQTELFFVLSNRLYVTVCQWGPDRTQLEKHGGFRRTAGAEPKGYRPFFRAEKAAKAAAKEYGLTFITREEALAIYH